MKHKRDAWNGLGDALRKRRVELGRTATDVASEARMARSYLSQIERGEVANPTIETLARITRALGVDLVVKGKQTPAPIDALCYASPLLSDESEEMQGDEEARGVARQVREALNASEIPEAHRRILRNQVKALVEAVWYEQRDAAERKR